jgi:N-methylhydantoinase A
MARRKGQSVGVDTGGTFTDFAYLDGGEIKILKTPSTRANPAAALLAGLDRLEAGAFVLSHGSTVATNALLERGGARTALVTTAGFEDIIEIGRQNRPALYDLVVKKPEPLVPRDLRFGVRERVAPDGKILTRPSSEEIDALVSALKRKKVESVALCFLFSFANPANERAVAKRLRRAGFSVSVSSEILPEFREYERLSTTVVNAYTSPVLERHVDALLADARLASLEIMISNGGSLPAREARSAAVHTVLSGPAGGVIAARRIADEAGFKRIISMDIGGTSTDVCLSTGEIPFTSSYKCGGLPVSVPVIDVHTIGAGGGSIAHIDAGGALRVGPQSVGGEPGPACYGIGAQAALTDADLVLGFLPAAGLLGGTMPLDVAASRRALKKLAARMKMSVEEFAEGVVAVADANVEQAVRLISVERGHDPREFVLVAFGGAGPVHAASVMGRLDIGAVLVPQNPGVLSACGLLFADAIRDYSQTVFERTAGRRGADFHRLLEPLVKRAEGDLAGERDAKGPVEYLMSADMRYAGQSFELNVAMQDDIEEGFHRAHEREYGYCDRGRAVEIVTVRLRAIARRAAPRLVPRPIPKNCDIKGSDPFISQFLRWRGKRYEAGVYRREMLRPGEKFAGPALVVEYSATTVVPPGCECGVDGRKNLIIKRAQ